MDLHVHGNIKRKGIKMPIQEKSEPPRSLTVAMVYDKETPGTIRFKEVSPITSPKFGTLYMKKTTFVELGEPDSIVLTVEAE